MEYSTYILHFCIIYNDKFYKINYNLTLFSIVKIYKLLKKKIINNVNIKKIFCRWIHQIVKKVEAMSLLLVNSMYNNIEIYLFNL